MIDFDTNGGGRAVISAGNPDTATHVTTSVPGMNSNLAKIDGDMKRMDTMWSETDVNGGQRAVITWLGYDAPKASVKRRAVSLRSTPATTSTDSTSDA